MDWHFLELRPFRLHLARPSHLFARLHLLEHHHHRNTLFWKQSIWTHQSSHLHVCGQLCLLDNSIRRRQSLHEIISTVYSLVLLLLGLVKCSRDRINEPVEVGVAEVRHAVSGWVEIRIFFDRWFDHTMLGTLDRVVAPPCEKIACVDHNRVCDGCCIDIGTHR